MNGSELRQRLERLRQPFSELAPLLGLSIDGLNKQMSGSRRVSRQTEMLLDQLELIVELGRGLTRTQKRAVVENALRKFEHRERARQTLARSRAP